MYWLIGFDENGLSRLGSSYIIRTDYKSDWRKERLAYDMIKRNKHISEVYCIRDAQYSSQVQRMGEKEFSEHIRKVGKIMYRCL